MSIKINDLKELEHIVANAMLEAILQPLSETKFFITEEIRGVTERQVYERYESPIHYKRRGDDGGLLDTRNIELVDAGVNSGTASVSYAQIAEGNFKGANYTKHLAETINDGYGDKQQPWNKPSRHLTYMEDNLIRDYHTGEIIDTIKVDLRNLGYEVR